MRSFIPWIGGKTFLAGTVTAEFPQSFSRYIEVFGGSGAVLFSRENHGETEIYNDLDGELVNLFRCIKYHRGELERQIEESLISRETFFDYKEMLDCRGFTDIQRAAMFYYVVRLSFGANRAAYGCENKSISTVRFKEISDRLSRVNIEHKDFEELIRQYDEDGALFYCDPPYCGSEKRYSVHFERSDHIRLKECLENISGKFLVTYNDSVFIRELYRDFEIIPIKRQGRFIEGESSEVIIKNYTD